MFYNICLINFMYYMSIHFFSDFMNFVKSSLINLKYEIKVLSYSLDSIKTILQSIEMNTSHITSTATEHNNLDIQELIWPVSNLEQLNDIEKLLTDHRLKRNEVSEITF